MIEIATGYGYLKNSVIALQKERYNGDNLEHERLLMKLWENVGIGELDDRFSKQWQCLGFQGMDPATDFRGMGRLALECMVQFTDSDSENHKEIKSFVLAAQHPKIGYPFAMLCINITAMLLELFSHEEGLLFRRVCYQTRQPVQDLALFYELFNKIVKDFVDFWVITEPTDVLNFATVRNNYKSLLVDGGRPGIF